MNEQAIMHIPDSRYCFALDEKRVVLRLRTAKDEELNCVRAIYGCKYEFALERKEAFLKKEYTDRLYDYYTVELMLTDVRLVYVFYLECGERGFYYSEEGLTEHYDFNLSFYNCFQLPYINSADIHRRVDWMRDACFYQIFVDRFAAGKEEKDKSYINLKWGERPNPKSFAGGDLKGITQKLPYLRDSGFNAIYLTPVFCSISNHKYDIFDYRKIDPQFGTEEDFRELVESAHEMGIRIVMDAVFNHCSEKAAPFQDVLKNGRSSAYFDWFIIRGDRPEETAGGMNYECFGACAYMPKWNTSNPEVQNYLIDIAVYWIREYGIDGWRLDVSDEVSHDFWRAFRKAVKEEKPECVIIGENWHDAYPYLQGDQYDSIMNYAFTKACLDYFAFGAYDAEQFGYKLNELLMRNTDQVNGMMLNLLDCHDTHRFLTQLAGNKKRLLAASAVLMMYPGTPCIYYGTEIPLEGGYDPDCRRTFDWNRENWDMEFRNALLSLVSFRREVSFQDDGAHIFSDQSVFYLERKAKEGTVLLAVNLSGSNRNIETDGKVILQAGFENGTLWNEGFALIQRIPEPAE